MSARNAVSPSSRAFTRRSRYSSSSSSWLELDVLLARLDDDVVRVVDHLLEIAERDVEQVAHRARQRLEEPDVRDRHRELDVAHALAPHLGQRHLDAAAVADHAAVADALVLPAVALPVLHRTEDALAEEAILLRLERAVVDGLGLGDLAPRPPGAQPLHLQALALLGILGAADLLGRGDADLDEVERRRAGLAPLRKSIMITPRSRCRCRTASIARPSNPSLAQRDLDAERLQLLHEHVERLRDARLGQVLPFTIAS